MCNSLKRWLSYDLVTLYHSSLYVYLDMRTYFDKGHTSYSTCKRILTPTHPKFRYKSVIEISKLMNFEPFWWLTLGMCTTFSARGDFRAQLVKTLVLPSPTCCDRSVFSLLIWGIFHRFLWIDWPLSWSLEVQPVISQTQTVQGDFTHETESPWPLHFRHSHWWKRWSRPKFASHLRLRDQRSMWVQGGCKVYMDAYMASNGSCFLVTWTIIFNNHLLEVGLTQNRQTLALRTFTTVDSFYFIMREDPCE